MRNLKMIRPDQIKLLHIYAHAAGLSKPAYRQILRTHAGVPSCADPAMTQHGFEAVMAAIETVLWQRAADGAVPRPTSWRFQDQHYWRKRLPAAGRINSRQFHRINQIWLQLCEFLPAAQTTGEYFAGIVQRATGRADLGASALTAAQAGLVIDALTDRLSYAIRAKNNQPVLI